jgi:hypothetical protein
MKQIYSYFSMILAAGEYRETAVYGNFINMLGNSGATNIRISIDGQPEQELPQGISMDLPDSNTFTMIAFHNTSVAAVTITFSISNGRVFDNRIVLSGSLSVNLTPDGFSTPAAVAVAVAAPGAPAVAASASNREVWIQNNGGNDIWYGDANVDGANNRGIKLKPDEMAIVSTSAAIYLRSTVGASVASVAIFTK